MRLAKHYCCCLYCCCCWIVCVVFCVCVFVFVLFVVFLFFLFLYLFSSCFLLSRRNAPTFLVVWSWLCARTNTRTQVRTRAHTRTRTHAHTRACTHAHTAQHSRETGRLTDKDEKTGTERQWGTKLMHDQVQYY